MGSISVCRSWRTDEDREIECRLPHRPGLLTDCSGPGFPATRHGVGTGAFERRILQGHSWGDGKSGWRRAESFWLALTTVQGRAARGRDGRCGEQVSLRRD